VSPKLRLRAMRNRLATCMGIAAIALLIAACGSTGATGPAASTAPSHGVTNADEAMAAVRARSPLFDGIERKDPNLIGQGSWWDAKAGTDSWLVTVQVGWGDCQAGCIDRHTWTFDVAAGAAAFASEEGTPLANDVLASLQAASRSQGIGGWAVAGPTCPVERPNDPACAPHMVALATLTVQNAAGTTVATFTTDGSGLFRIVLDPGEYTVQASPVQGLMGTPGPATVEVQAGKETWLDVTYDTGIR
jgi:hypothetical protein